MDRNEYMMQRVEAPESLRTALGCMKLRSIANETDLTEDRLHDISVGRTATIRRYELLSIKEYIANYIDPFIWEAELYRWAII